MWEEASKLNSATLHEAGGRIGALPCTISALSPEMRICAPAFPVQCQPGSNLALHHAIYAAKPGDALIADTGGGLDFGYWGEIMTVAALVRGLSGLVITGGVRDVQQIRTLGFPVFSSAISLTGTNKNPRGNTIGQPILIGKVPIRRGDLVFADADGVAVIPQASAAEVISLSKIREEEEAKFINRLRAGESTLDIYALPELLGPSTLPARKRRASVEVEGLSHGQLPIPAASRVGDLVATGGIRGVDSKTGELPKSPSEQVLLMFENLRSIVAAAGGTLEDIVKVTIWVATPEARDAINSAWISLFPDPDSRPSRHILNYSLPGGMVVQCEALASLSSKVA